MDVGKDGTYFFVIFGVGGGIAMKCAICPQPHRAYVVYVGKDSQATDGRIVRERPEGFMIGSMVVQEGVMGRWEGGQI